jgi:hypothetical protein
VAFYFMEVIGFKVAYTSLVIFHSIIKIIIFDTHNVLVSKPCNSCVNLNDRHHMFGLNFEWPFHYLYTRHGTNEFATNQSLQELWLLQPMIFRHTSEYMGQDCWWKELKQCRRRVCSGRHMFRTIFRAPESKP